MNCPVCGEDHAKEVHGWKRFINVRKLNAAGVAKGIALSFFFLHLVLTFIKIGGSRFIMSFLVGNIEFGFQLGHINKNMPIPETDNDLLSIKEIVSDRLPSRKPIDEKELMKKWASRLKKEGGLN